MKLAKINAEDFTGSIVGIVVAVIVVGAVLVPIVSSAETVTESDSNDYRLKMKEIGDETISISYTAETGTLFNGESPNFVDNNGVRQTTLVIFADTFVIICYGSNDSVGGIGPWYYYFVDESTGTPIQIWSTATGANTARATISNGTMTVITNVDDTFSTSYTKCYVPDANGEYCACSGAVQGLVPIDTEFMIGHTARSDCGTAFGLANDMTTQFHISNYNTIDTDSYTFNVTYTEEKVGNTDMYRITDNGWYIIPLEYTYNEDAPYGYLYSVIPIFVVVGIIMAVVGLMINPKKQ